jgi:hypothetical protein
VTWNRRFAITRDRATTGIVPPNTQIEDPVCILYGCSVLVILRKVPKSESQEFAQFHPIGECFIYGIMDGEAIDGQKKGLYADEMFEIV